MTHDYVINGVYPLLVLLAMVILYVMARPKDGR